MKPGHHACPDPFELAGRVALVTGGTSGIGRMIATALARAGARVYINGRDAARCRHVSAQISEETRNVCRPLPGDISSIGGVRSLAAQLGRSETLLHILVNNAGCETIALLDQFGEEDWDPVLSLNLKSPFFLIQHLLQLLRRGASDDRPSTVINIGSVGGLRIGPKDNYAYLASKAALHHLTGALAKRLGPEHITVNAIAPGFFRTELTRDVGAETLAALTGTIPRRRIGCERDLASLVGFLSSAGAGYITGAVIPLAGGMTL